MTLVILDIGVQLIKGIKMANDNVDSLARIMARNRPFLDPIQNGRNFFGGLWRWINEPFGDSGPVSKPPGHGRTIGDARRATDEAVRQFHDRTNQ